MIPTGKNFGVRILEALGLPSEKCLGLTIDVRPNEVVYARATYAAEGLDDVVEIIKQVGEGK